jgi:DNA invertase Pin-like site-specific DNA recombinase
MGHLLGYARISTTDQQPHLQVDVLGRAGCHRVFTETASGAASDRPVLEQVLDQLRPSDTLVVWKLDRLGRSLRHLVDTVAALADRGVGFRSLQEQVDTTDHPGRQTRLPRVRRAGRVRARSDPRAHQRRAGRRPCARPSRRRPQVMTPHRLRVAQEMYASGQYTVPAIAKTLGVSRASIYRHLTAPVADRVSARSK